MRVHSRRKTHKLQIIAVLAVVFLVYISAARRAFPAFDLLRDIKHSAADMDNDWNLILVNRDNYIPDGYTVELTELSNGEKVDSRIYPELQEMLDAARAEGLGLHVAAGYRTQEEQQQLLDEKIDAYVDEGNPEPGARTLAEQWVALPGTSEHQLGIAVDINEDTESSRDAVYDWLAENGHKYGFIKRYPPDKTDITGVINEPWHYRYVGQKAAEEIYMQGICLEEYIGSIRRYGRSKNVDIKRSLDRYS